MRPACRAHSKAKRKKRRLAASVTTLMLCTTPGHDLMLDGGVQVLGQFADDEHVDALETRGQAGQVFERPNRGEQAQFAAELHIEIAGPLRWPGMAAGDAGGGSSFGFQGQARRAHGRSSGFGQRLARRAPSRPSRPGARPSRWRTPAA